MISFRDYQKQCFANVASDYAEGHRRILLHAATGLGKTILISNIIDNVISLNGKKAMILAHREELLDQACKKFQKVHGAGKFRIGFEAAERQASPRDDVIIASVPTIGRTGSKRLKKFNPNDFKIIATDEVHHSSAASYQNIYKHFLNRNPDIVHVGLTATPVRTDGLDIAELFDVVSFRKTLLDAIKDGWLANIRGYAVKSNEDLNGIKTQAGDFAQRELQNRVNTSDRNQLIFDAYKAYMNDRGCVVFCVGIEHAQEVCDIFNRHGISAATINQKTPKRERKQILLDFESGKIKVLTNMGVLTEGWDSFQVGGIIMARPTKSALLYTQVIGRGLRLDKDIAPWKDECTLVDIVDAYKSRAQKTVSSIAGSLTVIDLDGSTVTEAQEIFAKAMELGFDVNAKTSLKEIEEKFISKNFLAEFELVDEGLSPYKYMCVNTPDGQDNVIMLPNGYKLTIHQNLISKYDVTLSKGKHQWEIYNNVQYYEKAFKIADTYIDYNLTEKDEHGNMDTRKLSLLKRQQRWHGDPATEKQKELMKKLKMTFADDITKGEAGKMLDQYFATRGRKK